VAPLPRKPAVTNKTVGSVKQPVKNADPASDGACKKIVIINGKKICDE
jgi:hypothetical protein